MLGAGDILWPLIWRARVHTIHLDRFSFLFFCRSPFSLATLNFCPIETQGRKETDGVLSPLQGVPVAALLNAVSVMMLRVEAHWPLRAGQCCKYFSFAAWIGLLTSNRHFGAGLITNHYSSANNAVVSRRHRWSNLGVSTWSLCWRARSQDPRSVDVVLDALQNRYAVRSTRAQHFQLIIG